MIECRYCRKEIPHHCMMATDTLCNDCADSNPDVFVGDQRELISNMLKKIEALEERLKSEQE